MPTSFPGFPLFPFPGAREGEGEKRDPGNKVVLVLAYTFLKNKTKV